MKKFSMSAYKGSISISPRGTYLLPDCNYCNLTAFREGDGFLVELNHMIKRNDDYVKVHFHKLGYVRTLADVYDIAKEYVKVTKVY